MPKKKPADTKQKPQHERFKELAREVGADESGGAFDKAFKKAVPAKRATKKAR